MNNFVQNNPANFAGTREQFEAAMEGSGPYYDGETPYGNTVVYFSGTTPVGWHDGLAGYVGPYTAI